MAAPPSPLLRQKVTMKLPTEYLQLTISGGNKEENFIDGKGGAAGGSFVGGSFNLGGVGTALGSFIGGSFNLKPPSATIGVGGVGGGSPHGLGGGRKIRPLRKRDLVAMTKVDIDIATAVAAAAAAAAAAATATPLSLSLPVALAVALALALLLTLAAVTPASRS